MNILFIYSSSCTSLSVLHVCLWFMLSKMISRFLIKTELIWEQCWRGGVCVCWVCFLGELGNQTPHITSCQIYFYCVYLHSFHFLFQRGCSKITWYTMGEGLRLFVMMCYWGKELVFWVLLKTNEQPRRLLL